MPILSQKTIGPKQHIAVWQIEEDVEILLNMLGISQADRQILDGFKLDTRKKEWLASRILL